MGDRQGAVPTPWGVVARMGAEEAGVHLGVDVGVDVGRRQEGHLVLLEAGSQDRGRGHIAPRPSAA